MIMDDKVTEAVWKRYKTWDKLSNIYTRVMRFIYKLFRVGKIMRFMYRIKMFKLGA